jgi:hypothetical protein
MTDSDVQHVNNVQPSTTRNLMNSLNALQGRTRTALSSALQKTKRLINRPEQQEPRTDDSDAERVSTASTAIEDAMTFCAADEAACSQHANMSATEYHKMLALKLGASLSTDGQASATIRSTRQVTVTKLDSGFLFSCARPVPFNKQRFISSEHSHRLLGQVCRQL